MGTDSLQLSILAVVEYQAPALTNHSKSLTSVLPDIFSPPGGDRGPGNNAELQDLELGNHESRYLTPIDEE